jgi:hypothetical protein
MILFVALALGLTIYNSTDNPPQKTSKEIYNEKKVK